MNKLFLDTNILLDLTLARQPFDEDAIRFFKQADEGTIEIHASALSFCNIAYILEKSIFNN